MAPDLAFRSVHRSMACVMSAQLPSLAGANYRATAGETGGQSSGSTKASFSVSPSVAEIKLGIIPQWARIGGNRRVGVRMLENH